MKTIIIPTLFALFLSLNGSAAILRVNLLSNYNGSTLWGSNLGGSAAYPVYKQINQAIAAIPNLTQDTIHVEGATSAYNVFTIPDNKSIVIIGAGYFLSENPQTSANQLQTTVTSGCNINGNGSQVLGIRFSGIQALTISASNVIVERCLFDDTSYVTLDNDGDFNINIRRNFFASTTSNSITNTIQTTGQPTGTKVTNNIFKGKIVLNGNIVLDQFHNNVLDPTGTTGLAYDFDAFSFKNNIMRNQLMTMQIGSTNITHNISAATVAGWTDPTNLIINSGVQVSNVFVDVAANTTDGDYRLRAAYASGTASAANLGSDGTERGVFGGVYPYSLSGLGPIPVIYEITTSGLATPGQGLPVTVKARKID